jgi:hypothetical protein
MKRILKRLRPCNARPMKRRSPLSTMTAGPLRMMIRTGHHRLPPCRMIPTKISASSLQPSQAPRRWRPLRFLSLSSSKPALCRHHRLRYPAGPRWLPLQPLPLPCRQPAVNPDRTRLSGNCARRAAPGRHLSSAKSWASPSHCDSPVTRSQPFAPLLGFFFLGLRSISGTGEETG